MYIDNKASGFTDSPCVLKQSKLVPLSWRVMVCQNPAYLAGGGVLDVSKVPIRLAMVNESDLPGVDGSEYAIRRDIKVVERFVGVVPVCNGNFAREGM